MKPQNFYLFIFNYLSLIIIFYNEKAKVTVGIDSVAQRQKYKTKKKLTKFMCPIPTSL